MAIAGGTTTAYYLWVGSDGALHTKSTTTQRSLCADVSNLPETIAALNNGERLLIAGGDIAKVRKAWGER
jgi:hypothetical protein